MTPATASTGADRLDRALARLLGLGAGASCGLIAVGTLLPLAGASLRPIGARLVPAGIVLLIALPTLRVATMGVWYLRRRDYDFAAIAALVLAIIIVSTVLGVVAP